MTEVEVKTIQASEFKEYASSVRSCKLGPTCELGAKTGSLQLDLSDFEPIDRCIVHARRKSGNGDMIVSAGSNVIEQTIQSKTSQYFFIEMNGANKLTFRRSQKGIGTIEIIRIELHGTQAIPKEVESVSNRLKETLSKCKKHKGVRLTKGRLFASESGIIEAERVTLIRTNPSNMFKLKDNKIKFLGSCEILDLRIEGKPVVRESEISSIKQMNAPANLATHQDVHNGPQKNIPMRLPRKHADSPVSNPSNETQIVYDSIACGNFTGVQLNSDAKLSQDKNSVCLGRRGSITIPISAIEPKRDYIVVVGASKVNGNGKLISYIQPARTGRTSMVFVTPQSKNLNMVVASGGLPPDGSTYKLIVGRPDAATGDINVSRLMLLVGIDVGATQQASANIVGYKSLQEEGNIVGYGLQAAKDSDKILGASKKYSRFSETFTPDKAFETKKSTLTVTSVSGLGWYTKVSPMFPDVSLNQDLLRSPGTIVFGALGALTPSKRIYIEEFLPKIIREYDDEVLENAEVIMSPSQSNVEFLTKRYPKASVKLVHRYWPFAGSQQLPHINGEYILVFNRSSYTTKLALDARHKDMPRMVVVGARGRFPDFVWPTNEYLPYRNLTALIMRARCIIDLPVMNDYQSSVLHMANTLKAPVLTSNMYCENKENAILLKSEEQVDDAKIPTVDAVREGLSKTLELPRTSGKFDDYNKHIAEFMSALIT